MCKRMFKNFVGKYHKIGGYHLLSWRRERLEYIEVHCITQIIAFKLQNLYYFKTYTILTCIEITILIENVRYYNEAN